MNYINNKNRCASIFIAHLLSHIKSFIALVHTKLAVETTFCQCEKCPHEKENC